MADEEALDRNIYLSCVIRIQALLRGSLVRKQIEDVKKSFEDLFQELEGNDSEQVEWETVLCVPKIMKKSSKKETKTVKPSRAEKRNKISVQGESSRNNICTSADMVIDNDTHSARFNSVEVQTSFIDVHSKLPARQLNESPWHGDSHDDHVLEDHPDDRVLVDLDTSWKDRVVPFIQNNFNDSETEDKEYKVNELHLDLNTDRESIDGLSSKSESSTRGSLKHSPREVESNLYPSTLGSVKSLDDHRKESFEDVEEIKKSKAARKTEVRSRSSGHSSRHLDADVNDDRESRYSNRSEHESSKSKSRPSYPIESRYCANDEDRKLAEDFENDRRFEKDLASENSTQSRSAPVSNRSHKSARSEVNNKPDSPKAHSSRRRTSNKSEISGHSKTYSDRSNGKPTNQSRNADRSSNHEMTDGNTTHRSDRSSERMHHSDRSDRSTERRPRSDRIDRSSERKHHSDRSDRSTERRQRSDKINQSSERMQHSNRSDRSIERKQRSDGTDLLSEHGQKSDRSEHGRISNRSDRSSECEHFTEQSGGRSRTASTSSHKSGGRKNQESSTKKAVDILHPPRSSVSPVNFYSTSAHDKHQVQDSTTLTNVTSVWDSFNSMRGSQCAPMSGSLPEDTTSLRELRKNVSMELLWVQQAIDSRKNYLKLKGKM